MADWAAWLKSVHFGPHWLLFAFLGLAGGVKAWELVLANKVHRRPLARAKATSTRRQPEISNAEKAAFSATLLERPITTGTMERFFEIHREALAFDATTARQKIAQGELLRGLDDLRNALMRHIAIIEDYRRSDPREVEHERNLKAARAALADIDLLRASPS